MQAIVTLVERKGGYPWIPKGESKTHDSDSAKIENLLKPFGSKVKTLTVGSGKEFCGHANIYKTLGIASFFVSQFASWA